MTGGNYYHNSVISPCQVVSGLESARKWARKCISFGKFLTTKMINNLPDLVIAIIFSYIPDAERICKLALVCKKWYDIVHSSTVWKKVHFDYQRKITSDVLRKYVYPGTTEILLSECCYLKWEILCSILCRCKRIDVLFAPWIGHREEVVPDLTRTLNIGYLRNLDLSHCIVTDSLFIELPLRCPLLKILHLQDCQDISEKAYITSPFKTHGTLEVFNVAYNREARSVRSLIEILKYTDGKVLLVLDIRGHRFTQEDFDKICEEHSDGIARIKDIESYCYDL